MLLFEEDYSPTQNLLPKDGVVHYFGRILKEAEAWQFYEKLLVDILWEHDEAIIFGKKITTRRKVAWYAAAPFSYTYSGITKTAHLWTAELLALKSIAEQHTGASYNSCLLNLYHDGSEGMTWHSDGEKDLKKHGSIASISLGAERKFAFKHKQTAEVISVNLGHGSLLEMKGATQDNWLHRLPPTKKVSTPRINLTFRTIEQ